MNAIIKKRAREPADAKAMAVRQPAPPWVEKYRLRETLRLRLPLRLRPIYFYTPGNLLASVGLDEV